MGLTKRRIWVLAVAVFLWAPADRGSAAVPGEQGLAMSEMIATETDRVAFTDFGALQRPDSPNSWLVAPADYPVAADEIAPVFPVDGATLGRAWVAVVQAQPRTTVLGLSADGLQVEVEQRSRLFGFVDRISFRAIPLAAQQSTLVAYSRSRVGYWDLGVNRGRLRQWLAALSQRVASGR